MTESTANDMILVVDDDPGVRLFLRKTLELQCYQVLEAADGMEALEKLQNNRIGLVIADVNMPELSGIDLLTEINQCSRDLPVIRSIPDLSGWRR